ncbi:hypothetical protein DFQ26_001328 [Actinomortierella ambigua]|nr:hypothetical protein DFQ26_001328 [Actinomortierella ambigua]
MSSKSVPRVPTIITAVPQEPLIKVCEFKKSFNNHADDNTAIGGSSTNNGATATLPSIFAQDKARFDAAAARCDIRDEIEASNAPFSDPTLFGLLKEWHDFLVIKAHPHDEREEAVRMQMGVRPTWKSMHAPPGEGSDSGVVAGGSGSGMSLLAGGLTGGVRKGIDRMDDEGEEDEERIGLREGSVVPQTRRSQEKRPVATRIFFNTAGKAADTSNDSFSGSPLTSNEESLEQQASSSQSSTSATRSSKADSRIQGKKRAVSPSVARVPPVTKIKIIEEQNMARLQHYLTPRTGEDTKGQSGFLKTAIEINIEKILQGIASSPLATLNVDQRFEVPTSERPPINFRNVYIPPSRKPKAHQALTTQEQEDEVVLTVTIQSSTDPSRQMQEIKLLGSNTLMDLRNVLSCPSDFALLGHDEPPEDHSIQQQYRNTATSKPSNSMFCIESRFYIDNPLLHAKADKKRALVDEEHDRQARLRQQIHERLGEVERQGDEQQQQQQRTDLDPSGMEIDDDVSELRRQLHAVPPEVDLPIEQMDVEYEAELAEVSEDYSA